MTKYYALLPDGKIATRKTHRVYTHIVAVNYRGWGAEHWCGRYDLAVKQANRYTLPVQIVEVSTEPPAAQAAPKRADGAAARIDANEDAEYGHEWRRAEALHDEREVEARTINFFVAYGKDYNQTVERVIGLSKRELRMFEQCVYEKPTSQSYRAPDGRVVKFVQHVEGDQVRVYPSKQAHDAHKRAQDRMVPDPETGRRAALYSTR